MSKRAAQSGYCSRARVYAESFGVVFRRARKRCNVGRNLGNEQRRAYFGARSGSEPFMIHGRVANPCDNSSALNLMRLKSASVYTNTYSRLGWGMMRAA